MGGIFKTRFFGIYWFEPRQAFGDCFFFSVFPQNWQVLVEFPVIHYSLCRERHNELTTNLRQQSYDLSQQRMTMESFLEQHSENDDNVIVDDGLDARKRARSGRQPTDVWNEIISFNPAPNGDHLSCQCKHCFTIFNHPIKKRAPRIVLQCDAYSRSKGGVSPIN